MEQFSLAIRDAIKNRDISRQYNHPRALSKANAPQVEVGECVLVRVNEGGPLDPKWDPGYAVTRVWGSATTCVGRENKRKVINRDQIKLVGAEVQ